MSEPIVFFGSGPVAAESLRLLSQSFRIEAVITKPRPTHHKGDVPVIRIAETLDLPFYTAGNKLELDQLFSSQKFISTVAVLIDFGIIVSQNVIDYFPLGIINSHFSLLPEWRGADPITFAVLSGQPQTGVSLMLLVEAMDEGPLLAQAPHPLRSGITTPKLTDELTALSYQSLETVLPLYVHGKIQPAPQDQAQQPTYSRKLTKSDSLIDWSKPASDIERQIRAFIGWPGSRTTFNGAEVTITQAHVSQASGIPGHTTIIDKLPVVHCGQDSIVIDMLKPSGKQEMTGQAFLAGYKDHFLRSSS